ncbi:MAG: acetylglutamate kinase [Phycisphaerales bacterium]
MTALVVVKLSGRPIDDPTACAGLWAALAHASEQVRLVVVHGGGLAVDRRLAALNMPTERRDGLRVTPEDQIGVVAGVLAGEVNRRLVGVLTGSGIDAVGVGLGDGGLCACEPIPGLGRVGRVIGGDGRLVQALHRDGRVPVVSSIGFDASGGLLNVNADDAASGVAGATSADRLVLLTDVPGVLDADGNTIEELDADLVERLTASGVIVGGMGPKARAALDASEACGADVIIGSWHDAAALIGGAGTGTRVRRRRTVGVGG